MNLPVWFEWGVPFGALAFGLVSLAWAHWASAKFDRRYGKRG